MIDLHAHFLPGVDDGPATLAESLRLAEKAVADGVEWTVMTPHVHPRRYPNRLSGLRPHFENFRSALAEAGIPLKLSLGGEVRFGEEALALLAQDELPFVGECDGFRVLLLEFPHQNVPVGSLQFAERLLAARIRPLIAHPERNKSVMARPEILVPFLDIGCWLQLTAGSLVGRFGRTAQKTAEFILGNRWAHVLATDAHNLEHRPPLLSEGRDAAARLVGKLLAHEMVVERPARILGVQ